MNELRKQTSVNADRLCGHKYNVKLRYIQTDTKRLQEHSAALSGLSQTNGVKQLFGGLTNKNVTVLWAEEQRGSPQGELG